MSTEGSSHETRSQGVPSYIPDVNPGRYGGGTYTAQTTDPTIQDYENIFGPSARDIKSDLQRYKRHGRWHLPDALKGSNQWLTDRVDGLITDATNSPFTTKILPYKYLANPDAKLKWNVWSFDEGMASRVPYESAARTLTQTKRSFAGYVVRQGLAIVLEHNFMMSETGRENFRNQLQQLVGSIQYTNDLDVHVALIMAPSYSKTMRERYYIEDKTPTQVCREFVDLFGFMQKNQNALDILIEEAKAQLKSWGGPMPDFLLCNSKLTFQLTMTPDKTSYVTQGMDGVKRLRAGPDLSSYRGINIIHSRSFSMDPGTPPRDILRRRVRVAEYYRILPHQDNWKRDFQFYNEERDTWFTLSFKDLLHMASCSASTHDPNSAGIHRAYAALAAPLGGSTHNALSAQAGSHTHHAETRMPRAPMLGMNIDQVAGNTTIELLCNSMVSAANASWNNWEPKGEFITDKYIMAIGAMSWQDFFIKNDTMTACVVDNLGNDRLGAPAAIVGPRYIPPERYYFESYDEGPMADRGYCDMNSLPYGEAKCSEYRNMIKKSTTEVKQWARILDERFTSGGTIPAAAGGPPVARDFTNEGAPAQLNALREQTKVSAAILFQSICEYPRNPNDFFQNTTYQQLGLAQDLSAGFLHGSNQSQSYRTGVKFRNWMRYGVTKSLINSEIRTGAGAPAVSAAYSESFESSNPVITAGALTFTPTWNKVNPQKMRFRQTNKLHQPTIILFSKFRKEYTHQAVETG